MDAIIASKPAGSNSHYRWTTASKDTAYGLVIPGETPVEHHTGSAAGRCQKGHGQHQRLSATHPEFRAGHGLASLADF